MALEHNNSTKGDPVTGIASVMIIAIHVQDTTIKSIRPRAQDTPDQHYSTLYHSIGSSFMGTKIWNATNLRIKF